MAAVIGALVRRLPKIATSIAVDPQAFLGSVGTFSGAGGSGVMSGGLRLSNCDWKVSMRLVMSAVFASKTLAWACLSSTALLYASGTCDNAVVIPLSVRLGITYPPLAAMAVLKLPILWARAVSREVWFCRRYWY